MSLILKQQNKILKLPPQKKASVLSKNYKLGKNNKHWLSPNYSSLSLFSLAFPCHEDWKAKVDLALTALTVGHIIWLWPWDKGKHLWTATLSEWKTDKPFVLLSLPCLKHRNKAWSPTTIFQFWVQKLLPKNSRLGGSLESGSLEVTEEL